MTGEEQGLRHVAAVVARVAAEFPAYCIDTQRTWGGFSLVAVRRDGVAQPGVYAVITGDLAELRRALGREPQ